MEKDVGEPKKLRHWSRGHLYIVRPCGHIDLHKPIKPVRSYFLAQLLALL